MNGMQFSSINRTVVREPTQQWTLKLPFAASAAATFSLHLEPSVQILLLLGKDKESSRKKVVCTVHD